MSQYFQKKDLGQNQEQQEQHPMSQDQQNLNLEQMQQAAIIQNQGVAYPSPKGGQNQIRTVPQKYMSPQAERRGSQGQDERPFTETVEHPTHQKPKVNVIQSQHQKQQRRTPSHVSVKLGHDTSAKYGIYDATHPIQGRHAQTLPHAQSVSRLHEGVGHGLTQTPSKLIHTQTIPSSHAPISTPGSQGGYVSSNRSSSQVQPIHHSSQNFRSPSQMSLQQNLKMNIKMKPVGTLASAQSFKNLVSTKSSTSTKNMYGAGKLITTQSSANLKKSPSRVQSLSQYSSTLHKPLGGKKSIKIMSNSAFNRKNMSSSNPTPGPAPSGQPHYLKDKRQVGSKLSIIQNKQQKLQVSPKGNRIWEEGNYQNTYGVSASSQQSDYYVTTKSQVVNHSDQIQNAGNPSASQNYQPGGGKGEGSGLGKGGKYSQMQRSSMTNLKVSQKNALRLNQTRESKTDSQRKKSLYTSLNSSGSKNKFGQPKNSVKPPTKKTIMSAYQYNPQLHHQPGARLKTSHSSLSVINNGQHIQYTNSIVSNQSGQPHQAHGGGIELQHRQGERTMSQQQSDRLNRKQQPMGTTNNLQYAKSMSRQPSSLTQHKASIGSRSQNGPHYLSLNPAKFGNHSQSSYQAHSQVQSSPSSHARDARQKYSSEERLLQLAEEEMLLQDEMIAQSKQQVIEREKKNRARQAGMSHKGGISVSISHAQKNMQALGNKAAVMAHGVGHQSRAQSKHVNHGRPGAQVPHDESPNDLLMNSLHNNSLNKSPSQNQPTIFNTFENMKQQQTMQPQVRQSPVDMPSSSNTSKRSNRTHSNSYMSSQNQFAPEVRQVSQQFNEIVAYMQNMQDSQHANIYNQNSNNNLIPQISTVISKMYQVKSTYDQLINNMGRHINQLQVQCSQTQLQQTGIGGIPEVEHGASQYNKVTQQSQRQPLSAQSQPRVEDFLAGTGGSINPCKHCKGAGQAPSSNSMSERQTYTGVSARADHDPQIYSNKSTGRDNNGPGGGSTAAAPEHVTINLPINTNDPYRSSSPNKKSSSASNRHVNIYLGNVGGKKEPKGDNQKSDSFRKVFSQIQKSSEYKIKIFDQNKHLKKQLQEKEQSLAKSEKDMAQCQLQIQQLQQDLNHKNVQLDEMVKQLRQKEKIEKAQQELKKKNKSSTLSKKGSEKLTQTEESGDHFLSEKELDLMVEIKKNERKLKKVEREKTYHANKISKLIYFFFTLQNKGIPVNELYEKDGVKFIKTDRFQEIMGQQNGEGEQNDASEGATQEKDKDDQYSFYSDDSFEYCPVDEKILKRSRFQNINNVNIPPLNFEGLPEYETTDDEEEDGDEEQSNIDNTGQQSYAIPEPAHGNAAQLEAMGINSPTPNTNLDYQQHHKNQKAAEEHQKDTSAIQMTSNDLFPAQSQDKKPNGKNKKMNKKDYQQSMQYIERFYQQKQQNDADQDMGDMSPSTQAKHTHEGPGRHGHPNETGTQFDDAPKSITDSSQHNYANFNQKRKQRANGGGQPIENENTLAINNFYNQSEKFDDSMISRGSRGMGVGMEVLGMSINSQSIDQSIIDQSMHSRNKGRGRKAKKVKEDLDGSRLYRDLEDREDTPADSSKHTHGRNSPRKNNYLNAAKKEHPRKGLGLLQEEQMHSHKSSQNTQLEGGNQILLDDGSGGCSYMENDSSVHSSTSIKFDMSRPSHLLGNMTHAHVDNDYLQQSNYLVHKSVGRKNSLKYAGTSGVGSQGYTGDYTELQYSTDEIGHGLKESQASGGQEP